MTPINGDPARRGSGELKPTFETPCPDCGSWRHESCGGASRRRGFGSAILGIAVLMVGAILLLDNFGLVDADSLFDYWPVILVLIGVSHFVRPEGSRR